MNLKLHNLTLQFSRSRELIDLSGQVTFFHGPISSGKTSVAKLIDACLGGSMPGTTAIKQEFVSAQLSLILGEYDVLVERVAGSNQVQVTWLKENQTGATVLAPIDNAPKPIWGENVYGLSDLFFHLAGVGPMRVRRNKTDPDAPLIPLSFRDVMWYCYLEQDELDSTFFHLEVEDPRCAKSRDVMRFVIGYYTERLNELEQKLASEVEQHKTKLESAAQLKKFFEDLGYESELEIAMRSEKVERVKKDLSAQLVEIRQEQRASTHFADDLRTHLRDLSNKLAVQQQSVEDLETRLTEEQALRSELLSTKFKLTRLETASVVLSSVDFELCPRCGSELGVLTRADGACKLCGTTDYKAPESSGFQITSTQRDLDARLVEIEESIAYREKALKRQRQALSEFVTQKAQSDDRLTEEMRSYDSAFLSQVRNLERAIATADQELVGLRRDARIPQALHEYQRQADQHLVEARRLRREITEEKAKLSDKEELIEKLETYFFEALLTVGFPSLTKRDAIKINRRSWLPFILPENDESLAYTFYGAGSGGKKTLFNVCYALALHRLTEELNLPLPRFLMIDSPMKNIGTEVNKDIFLALYRYLYELAVGALKGTQFIIVDTELARPQVQLDFRERLMMPGDPNHPPLIPYYTGH